MIRNASMGRFNWPKRIYIIIGEDKFGDKIIKKVMFLNEY